MSFVCVYFFVAHAIQIWELSQKNSIASMVFPSALTSLTVDMSERNLFVGAMDGKIYPVELFSAKSLTDKGLVQLHEQSLKNYFEGHKQPITALGISMDSTLLVSGSADNSCRVWDVHSKQVLKVVNNHRGTVTNIFVKYQPRDLFDVMAPQKLSENEFVSLQSFKKTAVARESNYLVVESGHSSKSDDIWRQINQGHAEDEEEGITTNPDWSLSNILKQSGHNLQVSIVFSLCNHRLRLLRFEFVYPCAIGV